MDCNKVNIKKGSKGEDVKELQTILKNKNYYNGKIDGDFGYYTEQAVKQFQSKNNLIADGWIGPVTCRALTGQNKNTNTTPSRTSKEYTIFTNTKLCEKQVAGCAGQVSSVHCADHAIKQILRRFGITKYDEWTIGKYAGTTSAGTSHAGIETAVAKIAQLEGIKLKVEWKNFSDLGSSSKERWRKYGDLMTDENRGVFHHELYRNRYGHYSLLKQVNINSMGLIVQNSLGSRCGSGYCGYMESRSTSTQEQYLRGISQKSICIITKV